MILILACGICFGAWVYPNQAQQWAIVGPAKISSWMLLVIISFMLFIMFFDVQDLPFVGAKRPSLHFQKPTEEPAK